MKKQVAIEALKELVFSGILGSAIIWCVGGLEAGIFALTVLSPIMVVGVFAFSMLVGREGGAL